MRGIATFVAPKAPQAPHLPKVGEIHVKKAKNGFVVSHYKSGSGPDAYKPQRFVFPHIKGMPDLDPLMAHLKATVKHLWLGGKSMEPRMPGAGKAHREKQLDTSGYPAAKPGSKF